MPDPSIPFDPNLFSADSDAPVAVPAKPPTPPPMALTPPAGTATPATPTGTANQRGNERFKIEGADTRLTVKGLLTGLGLGSNMAKGAFNLAEGGALLSVKAKLAVDTKVHIRIKMEKYDDVIECDGTIRWCRASAKDDSVHYVGVQFDTLDPAEKKKIARMRQWFTSPEYRNKTAFRRRNGPQMEISS